MSFTDRVQMTQPDTELSNASLQQSTSEAQTFNYTVLTPQVRIVVQNRTSELKSLIRRSIQDIIDIGQKLIEVKEQLGHGNFNTWLKSEFDWSTRTAARFMQVATQFKFANLANLNIDVSALYLLAEPSTSQKARQQALDLATKGENITYNKAKAIISRYHKKAQLSTFEPVNQATGDNSLTLSDSCKNIQTHSQRNPKVQSTLMETRLSAETIPSIKYNDTSEQKILPKEDESVVADKLQLKFADNSIRILKIEHQNSELNKNTSQIFNLTFAGIRVDFEGNPEALIILFEQMQNDPSFTKEILDAARLQAVSNGGIVKTF